MIFFAFVLSFGSFVNSIIKSYNDFVFERQNELLRDTNKKVGEVSFGIYEISRVDMRPLFRLSQIFLLGLTFLNSRKTKTYLISTFLTFLSFTIFTCWFVDYNHAISINETKPENLTEHLLLIGSYLDFLIFTVVSIFLFWQISILFRVFNKSQQHKNVLP